MYGFSQESHSQFCNTISHLYLVEDLMDTEDWFEEAWGVREEEIYPDLFGADGDGIYVLDGDVFEAFGKGGVDPRWLTHGVFKFPPNEKRDSWLYVTSGLSNAWHDEQNQPDGWSGLGCEIVMETAEDLEWALVHLQRVLAFQILLGWGRYKGKPLLGVGDRIPIRGPIDGEESELTWCLVAPPSGYPSEFKLPTGRVAFLHLVGITEAEASFARDKGYQGLLEKLQPHGYPVTAAGRVSVL